MKVNGYLLVPPTLRSTLVSTLPTICLLAFGCWITVPKASAQTIVPVSQARTISASYFDDVSSTNGSASATDFGTFNAQFSFTHGSASQNSVIVAGGNEIQASGGASGGFHIDGTEATASGDSSFSITFDIAVPFTYSLTGSLHYFTDSPLHAPSVVLSSGSTTEFMILCNPNIGVANFNTNNVLPAGEYTLTAHAQGNYYHAENQSYDLTFLTSAAPVPEPSTATLLLVSIAVLSGIVRWRPFGSR